MSSVKSEDPNSSEPAGRPRVRDRIFETACALFYRHGIRAVGVDAIASEAGTNKMSFYRSFASKDELVNALRARAFRWIEQSMRDADRKSVV